MTQKNGASEPEKEKNWLHENGCIYRRTDGTKPIKFLKRRICKDLEQSESAHALPRASRINRSATFRYGPSDYAVGGGPA